MSYSVSITILPEQEKDSRFITSQIISELSKKHIRINRDEYVFNLEKKSIDARRRQVKFVLKYSVVSKEELNQQNKMPEWKNADPLKKVCIIGSGPAGLFAALKLLENGITPVIIERGRPVSERKRDIAAISTKKFVDENSNYCFGEGGAGTFSDGKLFTRSNKRGNISEVLKIFHHFGADEKILTAAHPHIGTNRLPKIIQSMREMIIAKGGQFHFNTKLVDIKTIDNKIQSIVCQDLSTGMEKTFEAKAYMLATGHSASDIYELVNSINPDALEAKTFAVGVRVEHPHSLIDHIQFHGTKEQNNLEAAEYRLVTQADDRGVYSFCMCPGGFVVPSATSPDQIVVNGMSSAERNSLWSNAAIVVETRPEDIPQEFVKKGSEKLAGLYWRTELEKETYRHGNVQAAPAQRLTDFLNHRESTDLPRSSYTPGLVSSRLDLWIPPHIQTRLEKGFRDFNSKMRGFITADAVLIAMETRTSTPVRILRDKNSFESICIKGLYPVGEGAGYAGGIVSSAMDGINAAIKISELF